jgi:AcrR family transcriptional regulator
LIDNILNGSLKTFATRGYEETTIADISKDADVSRGYCIITFQIRKT